MGGVELIMSTKVFRFAGLVWLTFGVRGRAKGISKLWIKPSDPRISQS